MTRVWTCWQSCRLKINLVIRLIHSTCTAILIYLIFFSYCYTILLYTIIVYIFFSLARGRMLLSITVREKTNLIKNRIFTLNQSRTIEKVVNSRANIVQHKVSMNAVELSVAEWRFIDFQFSLFCSHFVHLNSLSAASQQREPSEQTKNILNICFPIILDIESIRNSSVRKSKKKEWENQNGEVNKKKCIIIVWRKWRRKKMKSVYC